jgi:SecD/SecF fusion protein
MRHVIRNSFFAVAILLLAIAAIVPPEEKLRLGKDLRGGTTLIYAVDIPAGADARETLAQTITILKKRVDPSGLLEIQMVAQGRDRIEVTMPLPSEKVKALRAAYDAALEQLGECSVTQAELERALREGGDQLGNQLDRFACGDDTRRALLGEAAEAFSDKVAAEAVLADRQAQGATSEEIDALVEMVVNAQIRYEDLIAQIVQGQLSAEDVDEALSMSNRRKLMRNDEDQYVEFDSPRERRLKEIEADFPNDWPQVQEVIAAYEAYEAERTSLDDPDDLKRLISAAGVPAFRITIDPAGSASENTHPEEERLREELRDRGPGNVRSRDARWCKINDITTFPAGPESISALRALEADPAGYFAAQGYVGEAYAGSYYILCWDTRGMRLTQQEGEWRIANAFQSVDDIGRPAIGFTMDSRGASKLGDLTGPNIGNKMAVLLDEEVYTAPVLQGNISRSGQISGDFTPEQINYIIQVMTAGSLSANLSPEPISQNTIAPEFGADNLRAGRTAGIWALGIVSVFMVFYYWVFGGVAVISLLFNAVLILGAMSLARAAFTLPGIAGVILTFGMAVDANVLIYERVREEQRKGLDLRAAVRVGYQKALSSIVDGNVTNLIVTFVLANLGTQEIKGFAITLGIGVVATMFSALVVSRLLLALLTDVVKVKNLRMLPTAVPAVERALEPRIDWMRLRYVAVVLSFIGVGLGIGMVVVQGEKMLDTEFRGGTQVTFELRSATDTDPAEAVNADGKLTMTRADVEERVRAVAEGAEETDPLRPLRTAEVVPIDPESDGVTSDRFTVKTYATNADAVIGAITAVFEDEVESRPALNFEGRDRDRGQISALPVYPVLSDTLGDVIQRPGSLIDVGEYFGGVAVVLDNLRVDGLAEVRRPRLASIEQRLAQMRGKSDYSSTLDRRQEIVVLAGSDDAVETAVILVWDPGVSFIQNESLWEEELASVEWDLAVEALGSFTTLASVQSFSSVIAEDFKNTAVVAVFLSLLLILIYIWVRFGSVRYSMAAIVTLTHDVLVAIGLIALAEILYDNDITASIAQSLLIEPFKIDLNLVAAILTIIGYSLNDTIIIMDRIRENRGRMPYATKKVVNESINQTISRTVITSGTTLLAALILYTMGGAGVRAFSYALLCGVVVGTYSSIAVAAPLVWSRRRDLTEPARTGKGGAERIP